MSTPSLLELRLPAFKSFSNAVLPVDAVTVLIGRNSAGKSNALDGIEVLSRLASGEELADALDGRRREGGPVRGGSRGCAPHGKNQFSLGCTVRAWGNIYKLDVVVQVRPELRIVSESLQGPAPGLSSGKVEDRYLLHSRPFVANDAGLAAEVYNGKRGGNPAQTFRDSRLLTSQLPLRMDPKNDADQAVVNGALAVISALRGTFHLDPVPHLMREYVPERDSDLRRTGENISASLHKMANHDELAFGRLIELVRQVGDHIFSTMTVTTSELGDVMLAVRERASTSRRRYLTPAREMSDGMLRFIAIATALLTSNRGLDIDPGMTARDVSAGVLLVIEELENGLHPSQAGTVLELIKEVSAEYSTQVMLTTHSPALLNAMTGNLNRSVIVCYRDIKTGQSQLSRLTDMPGYAEAMASGKIGDVVTQDKMVRPEIAGRKYEEFNRLLGIS